MELKIINKDGTEAGKMKLPVQFSTPIRRDIIQRAVETIEKNARQPYGSFDGAGKRQSGKLSRRRNDYKGSYGHGISRVPRKIMSVRGTRFNWVGAVAPGTVGGRRAHPPKVVKVLFNKINSKENRFAIRSALAASVDKKIVSERGHKIPSTYPFAIDDSFESMSKTSELLDSLIKIGFEAELERTSDIKSRAGKGKSRGRRRIKRKGILFITSKKSSLNLACQNIPGFETSTVDNINAKLLAPGGAIGRAVLMTKGAIERLSKEGLFTEDRKVVANTNLASKIPINTEKKRETEHQKSVKKEVQQKKTMNKKQ